MEGQSQRDVLQLEPAGVVRVLRPADHLTTARPRHEDHAMPRFLIERDIPNAGAMTPEQLADATQHSNAVLAAMDADLQWRHSHVAGDRIYCVYAPPSEGLLREHAGRSGFPAHRLTPLAAVLGPAIPSIPERTEAEA